MSVFTILEKLAPLIEGEVKLILNSEQEAHTLKSKLKKIQEGLQDAETRGVTEQSVKSWLEDLKDVMYEMDDALDKWETKKLELQIEQSEYNDISHPCEKVRSLFLSLCLSFKRWIERREITKEMKNLSANLDMILAEKGKYNFVPNNTTNNSRGLERPETTSPVDMSKEYVGRKSEINSLVELLLSQNGSQVISIVGVGGLGKTTLAQLVYNDSRVEEHFGNLKAWVSVPDPFDASHVAKVIAEAFDISSSGTVQNIGQRIKAVVSSKRNFLVVLDDMWTVDPSKWDPLKNFLVAEPGCRLLVTTRDEEMAARLGTTTHLRPLNKLSDLDCGTISNKIALKGRSAEEHEQFWKIGLEIAKMCNGLPLAAETIGHMLKSRITVEEWEEVLESPLWKYKDEMRDTFRPLRLSYMDLEPIVQSCFLSSVLYSKGSPIDVGDLIRIWMGQGYISSSATWDDVHRKGNQYFNKLLMRFFFQEVDKRYEYLEGKQGPEKSLMQSIFQELEEGNQCPDELMRSFFQMISEGKLGLDKLLMRTFFHYHVEGGVKYKMHDVMHELAHDLSRSEYYFILDGRRDQGPYNMPSLASMGRIRNFCVTSVSQQDLPRNLFRLLKRVRVLCLRDCDLEELSQEMGELIHLRYLDLSENPVKELPEAVCDLYNLQTLDLRWCENLSTLPHGIGKLIKLRHLLIYGTASLKEYPQGLEKLTGLWTLEKFVATRDTVGCLRNLNQLRGSLRIDVEEGLNEAAAERADLGEKNHIEILVLYFFSGASMDVIQPMLPVTSLNKLKILKIINGDYLPALGKLPELETLDLTFMDFERVGTLEFMGIIPAGTAGVGGFPKLKTLKFDSCGNWKEWEDLPEEAAADSVPVIKTTPRLQKLEILRCDGLKALPHNLLRAAASLKELTIDSCRSLHSRYGKRSGADWDKISHIPHINIAR